MLIGRVNAVIDEDPRSKQTQAVVQKLMAKPELAWGVLHDLQWLLLESEVLGSWFYTRIENRSGVRYEFRRNDAEHNPNAVVWLAEDDFYRWTSGKSPLSQVGKAVNLRAAFESCDEKLVEEGYTLLGTLPKVATAWTPEHGREKGRCDAMSSELDILVTVEALPSTIDERGRWGTRYSPSVPASSGYDAHYSSKEVTEAADAALKALGWVLM